MTGVEDLLATDSVSDAMKAALGGLAIGLLFGASAQSSRFCLRSACIEFWTGSAAGRLGPQVATWLFVFGAALLGTQLLFAAGALAPTSVRQLANPGTLSGAVIGGLMFGAGMILSRGCASRLLVLSATGNLRALLAGLVVTVVAQASLNGILSPARLWLSSLAVVGPDVRNLMGHVPEGTGAALGAAIVVLALVLAIRHTQGWGRPLSAVLVGVAVALGWGFTSALAQVSFEPIAVGSVSFTGPSADTLMAFITTPSLPLTFSIGLVPGVFLGSAVSSILRREFRLQSFTEQTGTARYVVGAAAMGFGSMLAGGCAVGAGVTGGAVLSATAWAALFAMWCGAGVCHYVLGDP
jgi:uncharacterized membrane protein YedE/YeeE